MIPGQWDGPRKTAQTVELGLRLPSPAPKPSSQSADGARPALHLRERPGWERVGVFAAILLAASWLVMWLDAASR
jgi:hypothetical protein